MDSRLLARILRVLIMTTPASACAARVFFPSLIIFKEQGRYFRPPVMENKGFEPLTLGLQSRCSSQLS